MRGIRVGALLDVELNYLVMFGNLTTKSEQKLSFRLQDVIKNWSLLYHMDFLFLTIYFQT